LYDSIQHYQNLIAETTAEFHFRGRTPEDIRAWQTAFRPRLSQALGLDVMAEALANHQPHADCDKIEEFEDHTRECWRLWVEPTVPLPFYLLRPKGQRGPLPLVLTPHGHNHPHIYVGIYTSEAEHTSMTEGERDIAVQAVREGYLVIAPTARAFGETRTAKDAADGKVHSCRSELMADLLVGRTPIGVRVWDIARLIDWALAHEAIDASRIAITGNSGGGTLSVWAPACDERITVAMPASYFCTFQGSIGSIYHCDCNYVPGILRLGEMYDIAGLIAPRPFLAIAGKLDDIFPVQHVKFAFEQLRQIYKAAGVPERCELYLGEGGHRYYKARAWPFVREWFAKA
jgi:dienelactone hydrolase